MSNPTDSLSIENVVASTAIDQFIDLEALSEDLTGVSYDQDRFPGLVYRTQDPKAASLIFRSGKLVCTGAAAVADAKKAIELTFDALRELGLAVPDPPDISIVNIVTSGDLDQRLNLIAISIGLGLEHVEYEPEQFPGLVYRMAEPDVVILLFGSGKLVITGAKQPEDAETAIEVIEEELLDLDLLEEPS